MRARGYPSEEPLITDHSASICRGKLLLALLVVVVITKSEGDGEEGGEEERLFADCLAATVARYQNTVT